MELITERSRIKGVADAWTPNMARSSGQRDRKLEDDLGEIARVEPLQSISEHGQQNHRQRLMDADRLLRMSKPVTKVAVLYTGDGTAVFEICESCATKVKTP